ncbi:MAG: S46 family peptidase, partial [Bacteroidota bacterium]|nr:S46 family peptidase [Bacteroidota bacterium]
HPQVLHRLNEVYEAYFEYYTNHPNKQAKLLSRLLSVANGRKAYAGMLMGLNDEYLMKKKYDFENKLKAKVKADPELSKTYGSIWEEIDRVIDKLSKVQNKILHLGLSHYHGSSYFKTAQLLARLSYSKSMGMTKADEYFAEAEEEELQKLLTIAHEGFLRKVKGESYKYLSSLYGNKQGKEALDFFLKNTQVDDKAFVISLAEKGSKAIKNSKDPVIQYALNEYAISSKLDKEKKALENTLAVLNQKLGLLIYKVYSDKIPPDATASLRISHGKIKGYEYNGTLAPAKTTYYGLWDRYHSFGEKPYPWDLHDRWKEVPEGLDLSIDIGFASTNDIVGGNSGSSVINKKGEVVGLIHDGNLESLSGSYAFLREDNRAVATDSHGLFEALKYVYKTERLMVELKNGKIK